MKRNITMIISIGCVALILTMLMFTQFKTVDETDIMAIETMRETELRTELANWKEKYQEIELELEEREQRISEYKEKLNSDADSSTLLSNEVKEAEAYLGYTDVHGEGIIINLLDKDKQVDYWQLLELVNELNSADAEAISINGERIISTTDITLVNKTMILVNSAKISGPFEVKAIGNKKYLESSLIIKNGYIDRMLTHGIDINYTLEDDVVIPACETKLRKNLEYSQEYKEVEQGEK